jgi:hypothetical protein
LVFVSASKANATIEPTSCGELLGRKSREPLGIKLATFQHSLLRVTTEDILKATKNFGKEHVIGDGVFGTVYRATLPEGRRVAIKRLHGGHQFQGDREFLAEMETIGKVMCTASEPSCWSCSQDGHLQGKKMWKEVGTLWSR